MNKTIVITIKYHKNDNGGDRRPVTIDYLNEVDFNLKKNKILNDFRTNPIDTDHLNNGRNIGKIPYSVTII